MNRKTVLSWPFTALLLAACATTPPGEAPAGSGPIADATPAPSEEEDVPPALRGIPEAPATETLTINGDKFDLYVWQVGKEYESKVCVRYRETGSRIWRNTCGQGGAQRVKSTNTRGFITGDLSRHQRLTEDAARVRKTVLGVFNGKVTITDLKSEILEALEDESTQIRQR